VKAASSADARALEAAAGWYARLCSGTATAEDRRAWRAWHDRTPENQRAWQRIEAVRTSLQRVPAAVAVPTLAAAARRRSIGRRTVLKSLLLAAAAGPLAYASWRTTPWQTWMADHRTATGERRRVMLADGTSMTLNTATAVDVAYSSALRLVRLHAGEILVDTAKGAGRDERIAAAPFFVETAHGSIQALGTRFTVRADGAATRVTVLDDAVKIRPAGALGGDGVVLRAGRQLAFTADGTGPARDADAAAASWEQGSLVAVDWRLGDLVAELARYRAGRLACDPAVADLSVSGAFPLDDTDRALAVIAKSLPVRIAGASRYWVTVVPR